ncbi:hypothetical protein PsorP6_007179 [Peronosclerospora sorghi]|uniref:Uncharacterized protein n=1 Tax=Peronosclerospora sorghi TaxID=230839 RepID=A0ACC0W8N4_9STRA|nr:hypothetical protein PsorP6_007179 [Peronosclerospora sorghi]
MIVVLTVLIVTPLQLYEASPLVQMTKRKHPSTKRIYKKRKATHTVRKEEMQRLELELSKLQKELEILKLNALVRNGEETCSDKKKKAEGVVLREAVLEQHLKLARIQSMFGEYSQQSLYRLYPTAMEIRLGTDRVARMKTLGELRGPKLYEARMFLVERTRGLSLTAPYYQEERYDNMDGDSCTVRFDVTPFRGAGSVEEVFAALQEAVFNAEIIISESSGNVTIREDDELGDKNLSQMRFVSQTPQGLEVETNLVLFSDFVQCEATNERFAIMASDFVDEDTKYPYKPNERIRRDFSCLTMVTSYRNPAVDVKHGDAGNVVVVTRWAINIIRRPTVSISSGIWDSLCNSHLRWSDLMFRCARQALGLPAAQ